MATPTNYDLEYEDSSNSEQGCATSECPDKLRFVSRSHKFCRDVFIQGTLNVDKMSTFIGGVNIIPSEITIGCLKFTPKIIETISGTHLVLASQSIYADSDPSSCLPVPMPQ